MGVPVILHYIIEFGALHRIGKLRGYFAAGVIGTLKNRGVQHCANERLDRVMQPVPIYHADTAVIIQQVERHGHYGSVKSGGSSQFRAATSNGVMPVSLRNPRRSNAGRAKLTVEVFDGIDACRSRWR